MPPKQAAPSERVSRHAALPISRVKKIIQLDDEIVQLSQNATFVITLATEMFIRYLAEQGHNVVKSEKKPRKTIQYKDLATAVSRIDNLEFLSDVIPQTTTYKQFKERRARETSKTKPMAIEKGQRTLKGTLSRTSNTNGTLIYPEHMEEYGDASLGPAETPNPSHKARGLDDHNTLMGYQTIDNSDETQVEDTEMSG